MNPDAPFAFVIPVWDYAKINQSILMAPVVVLKAPALDAPAVRAEPVIDAPVFRDIARRFLDAKGCEAVALELGGDLLEAHGFATLIGIGLPEDRPELLEMLGSLYAPGERPTWQTDQSIRSTVRRVARRG